MTPVREIRTNTRPAVLTWVPVTGTDGVVRMEMRWHVGESTPTHHNPRSVA